MIPDPITALYYHKAMLFARNGYQKIMRFLADQEAHHFLIRTVF